MLRDGSIVRVREVSRDDAAAMERFLGGLSERSRMLRFFSVAADLTDQARRAVEVDGAAAHGLVATHGPGGEIVGHAGYVRTDTGDAEAAFAIADAYQDRGLGTALLGRLAAAAHARGVAVLTALVLPENHRMIEVFRDSGFPVEVRAGVDLVTVTLPSELTAAGRERFHDRERAAERMGARVARAATPSRASWCRRWRRPGSS